MVQLGGGVGLGAEPLELAAIEGRGKREHFQGDPAPERDLPRLVHNAHTAAADLTHQLIIAQLGQWLGEAACPAVALERQDGCTAHIGQHSQGRPQPPQPIGLVREAHGVFRQVDLLAGLELLGELLDQPVQDRIIRGRRSLETVAGRNSVAGA